MARSGELDTALMYPMNERRRKFVHLKVIEEIGNQYSFDSKPGGKWMLYFPRDIINKKWQEAAGLYRERKLCGIKYISCSTAASNPSAIEAQGKGVILFACGPCEDEALVTNYGKTIIQEMNYTSNVGYIGYMADDPSAVKAMPFMERKNYLYRLYFKATGYRYAEEYVNIIIDLV